MAKTLPEINDELEKLDRKIDACSQALEDAQTDLDNAELAYDIKKESENFKAKSEGMPDSKAKSISVMNSQEERRSVILADAKHRGYKRTFYQLIREKDTLTTQGNNIRKEWR